MEAFSGGFLFFRAKEQALLKMVPMGFELGGIHCWCIYGVSGLRAQGNHFIGLYSLAQNNPRKDLL